MSARSFRALASRIPPFASALAAGAALAVLAAHQQGAAAVESAYFARWALAVLVPLALAVPRPGHEIGAAALASNLAAWVLPAGPQRGAAFGALLVAAVITGTVRLLARRDAGGLRLPLVPLAVAFQALFAAPRLLVPAPALLWTDLLPALAAGFALALLGRVAGRSALAGGALVAVALGGFGPVAAGLLLVAAGVAGWRGERPDPRFVLGFAAAGSAGLLLLPRGEQPVFAALAALVLLAPFALWPAGGRSARAWWLGGWGLALAAATTGHGVAALAPALLFLSLALAPTPERDRLATLWSGWLLAGAALVAGFPWLAPQPAGQLLAWLGGTATSPSRQLVAAVLLALAAAALLPLLARRWPRAAAPRHLALLPALLLAGCGLFRPETPLLGTAPVVLTATGPLWGAPLAAPPGEIVVELALAGSAQLPPGAAIGRIGLDCEGGAAVERALRTGIEVADWAARRPDLAARLGPPPATAWISWLGPDPTFFAQRYRLLWSPPPCEGGAPPVAVRIELEPDLPPELTLAIHRVGVRR